MSEKVLDILNSWIDEENAELINKIKKKNINSTSINSIENIILNKKKELEIKKDMLNKLPKLFNQLDHQLKKEISELEKEINILTNNYNFYNKRRI